MRSFSLLAAVLIFFSPWKLFPQNNGEEYPKTNIEIFSELAGKCLNKLENRLTVLGKEKLYNIEIENTGTGEFLSSQIRQKLGAYKVLFGDSTAKSDYKIVFRKLDFSTKYPGFSSNKIFGNKRITRKLYASFGVIISESLSGKELYNETYAEKFSGELLYDYIDYAQKSSYDFTKGEVPEESLFRKIIIPAVVIAVSAVTIILFFIVRNK